MNTLTAVSVEEYFEILAKSDVKLEYNAGEIVAMAGAKLPHNTIYINILIDIGNCLKKKNCQIFGSDMMVEMEACEKFAFPDITIVCDEPIVVEHNGIAVLENPNVIIEILSDSTESYDRMEKFDCYKTIKSLKQYVLVSTNKKRVEVFRPSIDDEWLQKIYTVKDEKVKIGDCEILFSAIYDKVVFEEISAKS